MTQKKCALERACNYIARKIANGKPVLISEVVTGAKASYQTAGYAVRSFQELNILVPGPRLASNGKRGAPARQFVTREIAAAMELRAKRQLHYING